MGRVSQGAVDQPHARKRGAAGRVQHARGDQEHRLSGWRRPPRADRARGYESDAASVAGPTNLRIQLDLFYDYRTNPQSYPAWQKFLRDQQPKTLIFWGEHDPFFTPAGGEAYLQDLPKAEIYRLNAGHFATEDNLPFIADHIIAFYDKAVKSK